jgi:hypothetical protein
VWLAEIMETTRELGAELIDVDEPVDAVRRLAGR